MPSSAARCPTRTTAMAPAWPGSPSWLFCLRLGVLPSALIPRLIPRVARMPHSARFVSWSAFENCEAAALHVGSAYRFYRGVGAESLGHGPGLSFFLGPLLAAETIAFPRRHPEGQAFWASPCPSIPSPQVPDLPSSPIA